MVYEAYDALEMQPKQFWKMADVPSNIIIRQIVEVNWQYNHDDYTASIIAHYQTSNMAAVFSDCTLRATLIYKIHDWMDQVPSAITQRSLPN